MKYKQIRARALTHTHTPIARMSEVHERDLNYSQLPLHSNVFCTIAISMSYIVCCSSSNSRRRRINRNNTNTHARTHTLHLLNEYFWVYLSTSPYVDDTYQIDIIAKLCIRWSVDLQGNSSIKIIQIMIMNLNTVLFLVKAWSGAYCRVLSETFAFTKKHHCAKFFGYKLERPFRLYYATIHFGILHLFYVCLSFSWNIYIFFNEVNSFWVICRRIVESKPRAFSN